VARGYPSATTVPSDRQPQADGPRKRARELGLEFGPHPTGEKNAITDVTGVRVGQVTVIEGDSVRTGVTAIVPDAVDRPRGSIPAGLFVGNGYGKLIGATQLAELGEIESPVVLTGTLSAFRAADALLTYLLRLPGNEGLTSASPVVGETNDGYLSDIRARPVTEQHVLSALATAGAGPVAEGAVGAGTGTSALGFKAGIGTASRVLTLGDDRMATLAKGRTATPGDSRAATVGVLVQANFSGVLTVRGVRVAAATEPRDSRAGERHPGAAAAAKGDAGDSADGNSCMIVVATDLGLDSRQLARVARRAVFAMGRTGADFAHGSGDYAIAFSTASEPGMADAGLNPVFGAVQDAVEEAILNSVFMATTTIGYLGRIKHAVPLHLVTSACRAAGVAGD
jgi:D-aminopeptidase